MDNPSLSQNAIQMQQVDDICNAFEAAFRAGESPSVEEYLNRANPALHSTLLPELIQLEVHYQGDSSADELSVRFPQLKPEWLSSLALNARGDDFPQIPGYCITGELGRGGMGIVYLATDERLLRRVALKMIRPGGSFHPEHRRRFLGEARAAAQLHHPNLVQVYDAGEHEGLPFLVLELIEGGTLADKIRDKCLSFEAIARLMEVVSRAAHYAHQRHIIHRDLKPSNILIDSDGIPRISDFGLAKRLDDDVQQTVSGVLVGTPSYMAPEQASGHVAAASASTDVYSLGAILYELLTFHPPFKAASVMETLEQLRTKEPVAPRSINPRVPRDLETICLKCLQKEPGRRYVSAEMLADELTRFIDGDSIIARPTNAMERTSRWCRRHPLPAGLAVTLAAVVLIGFVAVWSQWLEADRQRKIAESNAVKFLTERDIAIKATELAEMKSLEAEQQRQLAEKHLAASESRFRKAQAPIQELIRLGSQLVRQPNMIAQGQRTLELATRFRQDLLKEKSDDPEVMFVTAATLNTLGRNLIEQGQFVEAQAALMDAELIMAKLIQLTPGEIKYRRLSRGLAFWHGIALLRQGELKASESKLRQSVEVADYVLSLSDASSSDHVALGHNLSNLAVALNLNKKSKEAFEIRMRGVDVLRRCADRFPKDPSLPRNLSLALANFAEGLWSSDPDAAESLAIEALTIRRSTVTSVSFSRDESTHLISNLLLLANWYRLQNRYEEGEKLIVEALEHSRKARGQFSKVYSIRKEYLNTLLCELHFCWSRKNQPSPDALLEGFYSELKEAIRDFPNEESFKQIQAWASHKRGVSLVDRGMPVDGMQILVSSLRELCKLRNLSPDPGRYQTDIKAVSQIIENTGGNTDFQLEKAEAIEACNDVIFFKP